MRDVVTQGYWVYAYPGDTAGWSQLEPTKIGPELVKLGIAGVIPQLYYEAPGRLACRAALKKLGFVGAGAVGAFQTWAGLVVDYTLGPATAAALGVTPYPGTKWTGNYP